MLARFTLLALALGSCVAMPAPATADHTIPVKVTVMKPGRLFRFVAKGVFPLPDPNDDPTVKGAILDVAGTTGSASYALGATGWGKLGPAHDGSKGFRFKGSTCKAVVVKPALLKAVCRSGTGTLALPEPGPVSIKLAVGTGTARYCGLCGGTPRGKPDRIFKAKLCPAPDTCGDTVPIPISTRCCNIAGPLCADFEDVESGDCAALLSGTLAPVGQVCDGVTGACGAARTGVSGCCEDIGVDTANCFEGPTATDAARCENAGGTPNPGFACSADGTCDPP